MPSGFGRWQIHSHALRMMQCALAEVTSGLTRALAGCIAVIPTANLGDHWLRCPLLCHFHCRSTHCCRTGSHRTRLWTHGVPISDFTRSGNLSARNLTAGGDRHWLRRLLTLVILCCMFCGCIRCDLGCCFWWPIRWRWVSSYPRGRSATDCRRCILHLHSCFLIAASNLCTCAI